MKCLVDTAGLRKFGKVVHALTLIGEHNIRLQFAPVGLVLATYNAAGTICAKAIFEPEFFMEYEKADYNETSFCVVPTKCLLRPFRSLRFLTKCTISCKLEYTSGNDFLQVTFYSKFGNEIQYSLLLASGSFESQEDADFTLLPNLINADAKVFVTIMSNFAHGKGVVDLTIKPMRDRVLMKNCMTEMVKKDGKIYTELCMSASDFYEYDVKNECELTIDMKEFKIFATFAENMRLPIALHFETARQPVTITGRSDNHYYTTLTLATRRLQGARQSTRVVSTVAAVARLARQALSDQTEIGNQNVTRAQPQAPAVPAGNASVRNREDAVVEPRRERPRPPTPFRRKVLVERNVRNVSERLTPTPPGSPDDRIRSLFLGLGHEFSPARDIPGNDIVLVEDSDEDP